MDHKTFKEYALSLNVKKLFYDRKEGRCQKAEKSFSLTQDVIPCTEFFTGSALSALPRKFRQRLNTDEDCTVLVGTSPSSLQTFIEWSNRTVPFPAPHSTSAQVAGEMKHPVPCGRIPGNGFYCRISLHVEERPPPHTN